MQYKHNTNGGFVHRYEHLREPIVYYRDIHWWANIFKTGLNPNRSLVPEQISLDC